jgi:hypothetical protein
MLVAVLHLCLPELFNRSFEASHFPDEYKMAYVTPLLKNLTLDTAMASVLTKRLECVVPHQPIDILEDCYKTNLATRTNLTVR